MEENKQPTWDDMIVGLCKEPDIQKCTKKEEVYKEIEEYLNNKYGELSSPEKIKEIADEITKDICSKREISIE